ncbi:c6 zinc finger domain-containing [Trichoderma arundinaceum]|uniref:C6 zinc finger domain-containing n=1 Tax=Trichoderma arundinaceum TaxID=490622 RepID=A0A395NNU2_TRIAR|nr:c6 zinc finger domain-containing [Trichoderma arundinaceum]
MIGRRLSRRSNENNARSSSLSADSLQEVPVHSVGKTESPIVLKDQPGASETLPSALISNSSDQPQNDPFELFASPSFYFDASLDYKSLELDLSGESLDLIPLPTVVPSMLQRLDDANTPMVNDDMHLEGIESWQPGSVLTDNADSMPQVAQIGSPSINEDNRQLIQHYLEVMKGYAKVDDRSKDTNNLFISAFSKSLSFPPLFYAILSFSASHLSMKTPSYIDQAKIYDRLAYESFNQFRHDETSTMDGLLSAIFVRVKKIHVTAGSVDTFFELIAAATDIVRTEQVEKALADPTGLISRIVVRLAILDARASHYGLGGGQLVQHLWNIPTVSSIFEGEQAQVSMVGDVSSLLRADSFRMQVAKLHARIQEQLENEFATLTPVRTTEIKSLYKSIQHQLSIWETKKKEHHEEDDSKWVIEEEQRLSSATYCQFTVLSALHSALLYLYTVYVSILTQYLDDS